MKALLSFILFDFIVIGIPIITVILIATKAGKKVYKSKNKNETTMKQNINIKPKTLNEIYPNTNFTTVNNQQYVEQYNYKPAYEKRELITEYEKKLYIILENIIKEKDCSNIIIQAKIRLADLIETTTYNKTDFNKICSKHVDFVLCEKQNLKPLLIIELDDNSHNYENRRIRDDFVNQSLVQSGYKVLRIRNLDKTKIEQTVIEILTNKLPAVFYV